MSEARGTSLPRRPVLAGASAAALGVTTLVLPAATAAASTLSSVLVASTGGVVYGWGAHLGEPVFGTVRTTTSSVPVQTPVEITGFSFTWPEIVQVTAGKYTSFGVTADGKVYAWGLGTDSQLGDGATSDNSTPGLASLPEGVSITQVSAWSHVFALQDTGRIWAWGPSGTQSGLAATTATPTDVTSTLGLAGTVGGTDRIIQVAAGSSASAALTATGRVLTWGSQTGGSFGYPILGQGSTDAQTVTTATQLAGSLDGLEGTADRVIQISLGSEAGAALGRDGTIHTWGDNAVGQLGTGDTVDVAAPTDIMSVSGSALAATVGDADRRIVQVAVGSQFMLALGLDGRLYAWGNQWRGRLGNGSTDNGTVSTPVEITGNGALPDVAETNKRIVQVLATRENGYALGADGRVYSWGLGADYGLGDGTTTTTGTPVEITGSGVFAELSPNTGAGATRAPRRIVLLGGGPVNDGQHVLAIDDRGIV